MMRRGDFGTRTSLEWGSPTLLVFKKMIPCKVEGKMKESFAVVKWSVDSYDDFKKSMMEMIMEKQIFKEHDLEQLLQCFLSLNSRFHHGGIVDAFSEIWAIIYGVTAYEVVMVDMGEYGEGSRVH
nr:transcription repressor OFP7-like [Tanacetum cinerariifolium]